MDIPFDQAIEKRIAYIDSFADEFGNRRATDKPFLAYLMGIKPDRPTSTSSQSLDEQLWWMLLFKTQAGASISQADITSRIEPQGALVHQSESLAIEYRTMVELCALHALWIHAHRLESRELIARCLDAAAWHTRELQPDNAINRPWATQVFIALARQASDPEVGHLAHLHAQTLVHNTSISLGVPDILSALILADVVKQLTM